MKANLAFADVEQFYYLSRLILVKDESQYDKFDRAFSEYVDKVAKVDVTEKIPHDWLENALKRNLSDEEKSKVQQLGSLDELMKTFSGALKRTAKASSGRLEVDRYRRNFAFWSVWLSPRWYPHWAGR